MRPATNQFILAVLIAIIALSAFSAVAEEKKTTPRSQEESAAILSATEVSSSSRCVICGDFLYKHNNPDFHSFQCIPMSFADRGMPSTRKMVCPVCHNIHEVPFVKQLDFSVGIDSDFCYHSSRPSDYLTNIHTCVNCGYTALVDDFYELPPNKPAVDDYVKRVIDNYFELLPSYTEWVKKELSKPLHDKLTVLVKETYKDGDWTYVTRQDLIPMEIKLDYLIRCYAQRAASSVFLAGMYNRAYYAYRQAFTKAEVIPQLRNAYLLTAVLLYEPEAYKNESALLEELANLATDKIRDSIGVKLADYTADQLITKIVGIIKDVNMLLDGTAPDDVARRARTANVTKDDLNCVRFVLFLELAANFLRIGDFSSTVLFMTKAEALLKSGDMFTLLEPAAKQTSSAACMKVLNKKSNYLVNHQTYMSECLAMLKKTIRDETLRVIYYPTQTYLIANLYYRLEILNYRPAKFWAKMARQSASIYAYLGLSGSVTTNYLALVDKLQAIDVVRSAEDYTKNDLIDINELHALTLKINEFNEAQSSIRAKPQECRDYLEFMWKILSRYNATNGTFPAALESLVRMEVISSKAANDFRCPVTGKKYGYSPPSLALPYTVAPLLYDEHIHDDDSGILGFILYTDGTLVDILSRQSAPSIGPMPE